MSSNAPRFHTAQIGQLRALLKQFSSFKASIGDIIQFRVVVDANFVIQELMHRVRFPERGATALEELVRATVVEAYAPRWLDVEMASAIRQAAVKRKLPEMQLWERWKEYRVLLKWDETLAAPGAGDAAHCDPKDMPYVLLEKRISADGILSRDPHIARMGGHPLTLDFVLSTRSYARAVVVTVSIRVLGVIVTALTLKVLGDVLRGIARAFVALPDPAKAFLLLAGILAFAHPDSRKWIAQRCADIGAAIVPAWNGFSELVAAAAAMHSRSQLEATTYLAKASGAMKPKRRRTARVRRIGRPRARGVLLRHDPPAPPSI